MFGLNLTAFGAFPDLRIGGLFDQHKIVTICFRILVLIGITAFGAGMNGIPSLGTVGCYDLALI